MTVEPDADITYGDDPALDQLWDRCEQGSGAACDDLWYQSPIDSGYEQWADTCGGRFEAAEAPVFCEDELDS